jgi:hypothetical protein
VRKGAMKKMKSGDTCAYRRGVIEYIEEQLQNYFVPGKNTAINKSTVGFKGKIIFKTYNPRNL